MTTCNYNNYKWTDSIKKLQYSYNQRMTRPIKYRENWLYRLDKKVELSTGK